jgi:hypothetical protein
VDDRERKAAMAQHLSRAEDELRSAQRFLAPPGEVQGTELSLAQALANARDAVADALDTVSSVADPKGEGGGE